MQNLRSARQNRQAVAIAQQHLDAIEDAYLTRNLAKFLAQMAIPHVLTTHTSIQVRDTEADLTRYFQDYSRTLIQQGVTEFVRIVKFAEFRSDDVLISEQETHVISSGHRLVDPYPTRIRLVREGTRWRQTHATEAIENTCGQVALLSHVSARGFVPYNPATDFAGLHVH